MPRAQAHPSQSERFPPRPGPAGVRRLRERLLAWYSGAKRDLPWRRTRDPYAIWVSEAMLQQTRVETVEPYWHRFLARFPSVAALAEASEDDVLAQWSGLGYYRRARALRSAARAIVDRHAGRFPSTRAELLDLPGIGPYTAGAIASIAFDQPEPLVDGNVARVFCRLFALDGEAQSKALQQELWDLARLCVPESGAGEWNQALMELGATLCTARDPDCAHCPLRASCAAFEQGRTAELPRARQRPEPLAVELDVLLVRRGTALLLEQRSSDAGRMAGMWQFPTVERPGIGGRSRGLFPAEWNPPGAFVPGEELGVVRHTITCHRIRAAIRSGRSVPGLRVRAPLAWIEEDELRQLALTGMTRKILKARIGAAGEDAARRRHGAALG